MNFEYLNKIQELLETINETEKDHIKQFIDVMVEKITNKNSIYIFGASHAGIIAEETYYRAGGLVLMNPIFGRELMLDNKPITFTSKMERVEGYGTALAKKSNIKENDLVILHSVSGRNPVAIDLAIEARKRGAYVVVITNVTYSKQVSSRHSSGKKLYELANLVLDNHGDVGDACVSLPGTDQKCAPTSTIASILIMNSVISESCIKLLENGFEVAPIFYSANIDGGEELNQKVFETFKDQIHYEF